MSKGAIEWYEQQGGSTFTGTTKAKTTKDFKPISLGEFRRNEARKLADTTMQRMKYGRGKYNSPEGEVAADIVNVTNGTGDKIIAQKIRLPGKDFRFIGDTAESGLIFQDIFPKGSARKIIITEGEFDALTIAQAFDFQYAVVSLPNGTKSVKKALTNSYDYLLSFKEVVIAFDADEPGQEATQIASRILGPKALLADFPKDLDASDLYVERGTKAVQKVIWDAQPYRPEGIISLGSLRDSLLEETVVGKPWIYDTLTQATYGRRPGELYFIGAGSGIGKTDFMLQQSVADIKDGEGVGLFLLEQPPKETAKRITGKYGEKIYHVPGVEYDKEEVLRHFDELNSHDNTYLFNHFGSKDWETLAETIRWLATTQDTKHFYIDHLTALIAMEDDDRKALDRITAEMASLAQELEIYLYVVSHLSTPDGKPHEEGGRVQAKHFKGSRAIIYWAHFMFGLERNTQAEDPLEKQTTTFRVLKDRYTGRSTGLNFYLGYCEKSGLLYEHPKDFTPTWEENKKAGSSFAPQESSDF